MESNLEAEKNSSIEDDSDEINDKQLLITTDGASISESVISVSVSATCLSQKAMIEAAASKINKEYCIFLKPKVTTIKLTRSAPIYNKVFDVLNSDWRELVKRASKGCIPDGLLKSPVETNNLL